MFSDVLGVPGFSQSGMELSGVRSVESGTEGVGAGAGVGVELGVELGLVVEFEGLVLFLGRVAGLAVVLVDLPAPQGPLSAGL